MAWALSPLSMQTFVDNNGVLIRPAKLYFYAVDTLDPLTVYQDSDLSVPYPQPVTTGGSGRVPAIYVGEQNYRVRIFDTANNLVEDIPELPGAQTGGGGPAPTPDTAIETGMIVADMGNGATKAGWVRLNGGTIGSALSGADERANADAQALFVRLWGQLADTEAPVLPSRGTTANGDWLANKRLTLPDGRNAGLIGLGTMGKAERGLLNNAALVWNTGGGSGKAGSSVGAAFQAMTVAQMPVHKHVLTDPGHLHPLVDPTHLHSMTQSAHGHGISETPHAHGIVDNGHTHNVYQGLATGGGAGAGLAGASVDRTNTGAILNAGTNIQIVATYTGPTVNNASITIANVANATGITMGSVVTGITMADTGGGAVQNNMQPSLVVTWYIRL